MIGKVAALKAAAAYGFACFAGYEVHERVVPAVRHHFAPKKVVRHTKPKPPRAQKINTQTSCPPAVGIATLAEPLSYGRSLIPMDDDNVPATDEARDLPSTTRRTIGYGQSQPGGFSGFVPIGGGPGGVPPGTGKPPTDEPTPVAAVPEPATWVTLVVGMSAVGWAIRSSKRRAAQEQSA